MAGTRCGACAAYEEEIRAWHSERIKKLSSPNGWLTLAGLFWLKEGENSVGSDPAGDVVFPEKAPKRLGTITVKGEEVRLKIAPGVEAACGGKPVDEMIMRSDADPAVEPDRVNVGPLTFLIIKRGGRLAVRLYDEEAGALLGFKGIKTFPIDKKWRITGSFEPYAKPMTVPVSTVIHTVDEATVPGVVFFKHKGKKCRLIPMQEPGDEELFFVFADKTNGAETYGGGRFLDAPLPGDGKVVLDFNKAYNPPCSFTPHATCPVPWPENRLPFRVEAGEMKYGHEQ